MCREMYSKTSPTSSFHFLFVLKSDANELKNYRLTSLLPVAYKLFTEIVVTRISETLHFELPREQTDLGKTTQQ